jgi:mannose-1-phosphate guanylyltransferase/mannose-6-phosphate isomerase
MIVPVILCGGSGTRLWPLSSNERPKQLLPLISDLSLCQQTALRFYEKKMPMVLVCGKIYADVIEEQMQAIGINDYTIIIEPVSRDTAPAIALAAEVVRKKTPEAILLVVPSDHLITNTDVFFDVVFKAEKAIEEQARFILFGITPTHPETGYGYIKSDKNTVNTDVQEITRFVEKPSEEMAITLIEHGCLWNSGMFMLPIALYLQELEHYQPMIMKASVLAINNAEFSNHRIYAKEENFLLAPAISIDYALMQETKYAAVIELKKSGWSDIGSWESVWNISEKDKNSNVCRGNVLAEDCNGSLIVSESGILLTVGLEQYIVVHTAAATLVMPRSSSQNLKTMLQKMKDIK